MYVCIYKYVSTLSSRYESRRDVSPQLLKELVKIPEALHPRRMNKMTWGHRARSLQPHALGIFYSIMQNLLQIEWHGKIGGHVCTPSDKHENTLLH